MPIMKSIAQFMEGVTPCEKMYDRFKVGYAAGIQRGFFLGLAVSAFIAGLIFLGRIISHVN